MNQALRLYRSTIGKKVIMAVTGLIGVGFLISHVASNLLIFKDPSHLDRYGAFLRSLGPLLYLARAILIASVIMHVTAAVQLTRQAKLARPVGYVQRESQVSTLGSRTIGWGGALLLAFIIYHILHFTLGTVHPDFHEGQVGRNVIVGFQHWPVVLFYVIAMVSLGLHLYHGAWSSMRTLGAARPSPSPLRRQLPIILAVLIAGGFAIVPIAVYLGLVK